MKRVLALLAVLLLAGCSVTRFAYDHADTYLRYQANRFFDFEGEAEAEMQRQVGAFLAWHRAHALPQYAELLNDASARMLRGVKRSDLEWGYDSIRVHIRGALGAAAREMAPLLDRLSPEQIGHLERRLAEENRKFAREQLQATVEERNQRRFKRNVKRLEEWFGTLTDGQSARVRAFVERTPLTAELRERDRKRRQAEFVAMVKAREATRRLAPWASDWERGREPAYARATRETQEAYFDLLVDLDGMLLPEQRRRAAERMSRFAADFVALTER